MAASSSSSAVASAPPATPASSLPIQCIGAISPNCTWLGVGLRLGSGFGLGLGARVEVRDSTELHLDGGVHWWRLEHAGREAVGEELSGHVLSRLAWGYEGRRHSTCDEGRPVEAIEPRVLEQ